MAAKPKAKAAKASAPPRKRRTKVVDEKPQPRPRPQGTTARPSTMKHEGLPPPPKVADWVKAPPDTPLSVPPSQQSAQGPVVKPGEPVGGPVHEIDKEA